MHPDELSLPRAERSVGVTAVRSRRNLERCAVRRRPCLHRNLLRRDAAEAARVRRRLPPKSLPAFRVELAGHARRRAPSSVRGTPISSRPAGTWGERRRRRSSETRGCGDLLPSLFELV